MLKYEYNEKALPAVICGEHPGWEEIYKNVWRMAFKNVRYPSAEGWKPYLAALSGSDNIWVCDSNFMVFFARYSNGTLPGIEDLDNFYRLQKEDGYISMAYTPEPQKEAYGERIMMPVFAWTEWEYYRLTGDASRFKKVLPVLVKYFEWIKANRRRPNGLYWYEDSGSSGLDNAPRGGYPSLHQDGSDICFVDLACQQALSALHIKKIAGFLGEEEAACRFGDEHGELVSLINSKHWGHRYGFYYDTNYKPAGGELNYYQNHKTTAGFWAMLCGAADDYRLNRLIGHILSPEEFWTKNPMPGLSRDDPNYDPFGNYHCGSVWSNMNYMVAAGLRACGRDDVARELAVKHLASVERVWKDEAWGDIWEAYSPEHDRPATNPNGKLVRANNVGCCGLVPISMLIEFIFGFDFDAEKNTVTWVISEGGRHGVTNLFFNGQKISLIAEALEKEKPGRVITVENEKELILDVDTAGAKTPVNKRLHKLAPGRHRLFLNAK